MATQLQQQADALIQDTLVDFVLIRTDQIESGDRLRVIDPVWAKALGQVMAREGQRTPIEVCRLPGRTHWTLVSGAHRLFGAQDAGIALLRAEIVSADRNDRRMREISENLWRRDLDPIDRAAFIAELVDLKRVQAGIDEAGRRAARVNLPLRKQVDAEASEMLETISSIYGFTEEVGAELGFTGRTIRNDLLLFRGLAPSLVEQLRAARHPVARNASQLRALAKLDRDRQTLAVGRLTRNGCKSVAEALANMPGGKTKPVQTAEQKRFSSVLGAMDRMSATELLGLVQSRDFHQRLPAEARALLAPMLRDGPQASLVARPVVNSDLQALIALIEDHLLDEHDPDWIVAQLVADEGAEAGFANGTYELKLARVKATCTAGGAGLLRGWMQAARKRLLGLEKAGEAA